MAKDDVLRKRFIKLKKAHNELVGVIEEITEAVEKVDQTEIIAKRTKAKVSKLTTKVEDLFERIKKDIRRTDEDIKGTVNMFLFNEQKPVMTNIAKNVAKDIFSRYLDSRIKIETKVIKESVFKTKMIGELGEEGWKLVAILEPPVQSKTSYLFQREVIIINKKKKKIKRSPA